MPALPATDMSSKAQIIHPVVIRPSLPGPVGQHHTEELARPPSTMRAVHLPSMPPAAIRADCDYGGLRQRTSGLFPGAHLLVQRHHFGRGACDRSDPANSAQADKFGDHVLSRLRGRGWCRGAWSMSIRGRLDQPIGPGQHVMLSRDDFDALGPAGRAVEPLPGRE